MRRTKIDALQVEELALIGCTMSEISMLLNCSVTNLDRRFRKNLHRGMARRMILIRRELFIHAMHGDAAAIKWFLHESASEQIKDFEQRQNVVYQSFTREELQSIIDFMKRHMVSPSSIDEPEVSGEPQSSKLPN